MNRDEDGLILPKKIINPCLESKDRVNLHRELKFNNKIGKNVLNQKTELQRVLQKQKERQFIAAHQQEVVPSNSLQSELGKVITERAQKLDNSSKTINIASSDSSEFNEEYLKVRAKLRANNLNA